MGESEKKRGGGEDEKLGILKERDVCLGTVSAIKQCNIRRGKENSANS